MDNVIYTYGGGEALSAVFNGIAMIFKEPAIAMLLNLTTLMGISWSVFQGMMQNSLTPQLSWAVKYTLITALVLSPKSSLTITDVVYKNRFKIDNIPIGLIIPATFFSNVGYGMTLMFDQAFSKVGAHVPYSQYGQSFGASLISQARNFKIQDATFRENMEGFIDSCMLNDVMYGLKYNINDLRNSQDIWGLVSRNASNIKMFNYRKDKEGRNLVTCKEGTKLLTNYWQTDIQLLSNKFARTIFGRAKNETNNASNTGNDAYLGRVFIKSVDVASSIYENKNGALNTIKQLMMINALADIPASYGLVRARQQQQESWLISGQLARETLPVLHSVFAALIYASFVLIAGMLVSPHGMKIMGSYIGLLFWIETWPPLFAVINLLSNLSGRLYGGDFTRVTMNDVSQIITHNEQISVLASGLMIALPYLSYTMIKGGAGSFVHLAGQLMGVSGSAATSMSQEVTSGNRSLDNRSIATNQFMNQTAFKTDLNSMYRAGHQEYQQADGSIMRTTASGETIFQSGAGLTHSVGSKQIHYSDNVSSGEHQSLSHEKSLLEGKQTEYSKMQQSMERQSVDFVARLASGESSGEHYNYGDHTSSGKSLAKVVATTKELHDNYNYSFEQASKMALSGQIHGGFKEKSGPRLATTNPTMPTTAPESASAPNMPTAEGIALEVAPQNTLQKYLNKGLELGKKGLTFVEPAYGGSLNANAEGSASSTNSQSYSEQRGAERRNAVTENIENIVKASKEMQFATNQSNEKSLADSLTSSYEASKQLREEIQVSEQKIDRYQNSHDTSQVKSINTLDDLYHKKLNFIAGQKNPNLGIPYGYEAARRIMENPESKEYKKMDDIFVSRYIKPSMPQVDFSSTYEHKSKALKDNNPVNDNVYKEGLKNAKASMDQMPTVTPEAKDKFEHEQKANKNNIQFNEDVIKDKGQEIQNKINEQELKKGYISKKFLGRKKSVDDEFND